MGEPFIGEIRAFANIFVPEGWLKCDGTTLPVLRYQALYAIIGNIYGGDHINFKLPNLNGLLVASTGLASNGASVTNYTLGQTAGTPNVTLDYGTMAAHTHQLQKKNTSVASSAGKTADPQSNSDLGSLSDTSNQAYPTVISSGNPDTNLVSSSLGVGGATTLTAHENRQPFLSVYYAIAIDGVFPTKD